MSRSDVKLTHNHLVALQLTLDKVAAVTQPYWWQFAERACSNGCSWKWGYVDMKVTGDPQIANSSVITTSGRMNFERGAGRSFASLMVVSVFSGWQYMSGWEKGSFLNLTIRDPSRHYETPDGKKHWHFDLHTRETTRSEVPWEGATPITFAKA